LQDNHPKNKQEVGRRLALIAWSQIYDQPGEFTGPVYNGMKVEGSAIRVFFDHAAGLIANPAPFTEFQVAGADRKFFPAAARIEGQSAIISSPDVPQPVAVRYAFRNATGATLFNEAGLPAAPFRSDDWPLQEPAGSK
jgi:sialate O-acetylesterase